jgi:predicted phage terminase large subunit-like protein
MFPVEKFTIHPLMDRSQILHSVRYWDKAGTEDGGAYTAGVLMHKLLDGRFTVEHVVRGQWAALERESHIRQWTKIDATKCPSYDVWVEQEPGSGGKESAENTVRQLSGYNVHVDKVTGAKEVRAEPYAAQVQGGNILLVPGEWDIAAFIDEHEVFPNGRHKKDQVDAAAGAFAQLALKSDYDHSYRGWAS